MTNKPNANKNPWLEEFNDFLASEDSAVPTEVHQRTMAKMTALFRPRPQIIFAKILGIHAVVGFFSLAFCHQFGMNPFKTQSSLADVFMQWTSHSVCMVLCGIFFTSLSFLVSQSFLTTEETLVLKNNRWAQTSLLLSVTLGIFYFVGAELTLSVVAFWLAGALTGSLLTIEGVHKIKTAYF